MSQSLPLQSVAAATGRFLAEVEGQPPRRFEARVSSPDGMPLLCAIEAALAAAALKPAAQELVWLNAAPTPGGAHVVRLQAFGPGNELLAETTFEA